MEEKYLHAAKGQVWVRFHQRGQQNSWSLRQRDPMEADSASFNPRLHAHNASTSLPKVQSEAECKIPIRKATKVEIR